MITSVPAVPVVVKAILAADVVLGAKNYYLWH